jgi:hypothetical protein
MTRPNRGRKKTTLYVGEEDLERIEQLQREHGDRTQASAIRRALKLATTPPPDTTAIGCRILHWAEALQFKSPRETKELRQLSAELYKLVAPLRRQRQP